ncbi:hypothetical protein ACRCPS_17495 [Pseudomonas aeruginosa]
MKRKSTSPAPHPKALSKQWSQVRSNVIAHELGHWLVARSVGFATGAITITVNQQNPLSPYYQNGDSWLFPAPVVTTANELKTYLEDRICILYAGIAGQTHGQGLDSDQMTAIQDRDAATDVRIIKELMPLLRGVYFGPEIDPETSNQQSQELLAALWERTEALVEQVYMKLSWMRERLENEVLKTNQTYTFAYDQLVSLEQEYPGESRSNPL